MRAWVRAKKDGLGWGGRWSGGNCCFGGEGEMLVWGMWLGGWEVCGEGLGSCCGGDAQWREGLGLCVDYLFCDVM